MVYILLATITVSILHALIPSHWLPLLSISKNNKWSISETLIVTFYMGVAHVFSTILLGLILSYIGIEISKNWELFFSLVTPIILILLGVFFIYRHYKHHHFHLNKSIENKGISKIKIISSLVLLMFLSPCLEIEGFFLAAAKYGITKVFLIGAIYSTLSILGMLLWMYLVLKGLKKLNWHKIEHNAGLFTGFVLILCGIFTYFIH